MTVRRALPEAAAWQSLEYGHANEEQTEDGQED